MRRREAGGFVGPPRAASRGRAAGNAGRGGDCGRAGVWFALLKSSGTRRLRFSTRARARRERPRDRIVNAGGKETAS